MAYLEEILYLNNGSGQIHQIRIEIDAPYRYDIDWRCDARIIDYPHIGEQLTLNSILGVSRIQCVKLAISIIEKALAGNKDNGVTITEDIPE